MVVSRNDTRHPVRVTLSELGQPFLQFCRHEPGVNLYGVGKQIPWHTSSLFHSRLQGIKDHFAVIDVVVDHSIHSRTPLMAQNNHKPHAQKLNRIFYAGIVFQRHNITGNPDHEQLADALIKHKFRYGTCVGTYQKHGKWTLFLDQRPARGPD